ncbi:MAG: hypothetical protein QOF66_6405 [Mycobacterium sp.]|jgi:hypothetical protein|nr:hypothetical protein [Mycobacterium sp.]MDT5058039.1 hypothetical protein [Mycobacterium sp.]
MDGANAATAARTISTIGQARTAHRVRAAGTAPGVLT